MLNSKRFTGRNPKKLGSIVHKQYLTKFVQFDLFEKSLLGYYSFVKPVIMFSRVDRAFTNQNFTSWYDLSDGKQIPLDISSYLTYTLELEEQQNEALKAFNLLQQ